MVKRFELDIDKYQVKTYTSPVRSKRDVALIWMESIKNFLVGQPAIGQDSSARLTIEVGVMSRLFCTLNEGRKIFSVAFPFSAVQNDEQYKFYSREGVEIDNRVSSNVISLIEASGIFGSSDFSKFIDPIMELSDFDPLLWVLVRELMIAEDGYIRYDWDEEHENGHRHPLHHIDVCYSTAGSFKVGLGQQIDQPTLATILDAATDCHYLKPAVP